MTRLFHDCQHGTVQLMMNKSTLLWPCVGPPNTLRLAEWRLDCVVPSSFQRDAVCECCSGNPETWKRNNEQHHIACLSYPLESKDCEIQHADRDFSEEQGEDVEKQGKPPCLWTDSASCFSQPSSFDSRELSTERWGYITFIIWEPCSSMSTSWTCFPVPCATSTRSAKWAFLLYLCSTILTGVGLSLTDYITDAHSSWCKLDRIFNQHTTFRLIQSDSVGFTDKR